MSACNDGGSAFPWTERNGDGSIYMDHGGMSLRDYFIAHAPAEPQSWFEPVMPPRLPVPDRPKTMGVPLKFSAQDYVALSRADRWIAAAKSYNAKLARARDRQRYIQWPAAWADAMIAERAKVTP